MARCFFGCLGGCTGCKGECATVCTKADCSSGCRGGCKSGCSLSCRGCRTECGTACTGADCSSTCRGGCDKGCLYRSGPGGPSKPECSCGGNCSSSCGGNCSSSCRGGCGSSCTGTCKQDCSIGCTSNEATSLFEILSNINLDEKILAIDLNNIVKMINLELKRRKIDFPESKIIFTERQKINANQIEPIVEALELMKKSNPQIKERQEIDDAAILKMIAQVLELYNEKISNT